MNLLDKLLEAISKNDDKAIQEFETSVDTTKTDGYWFPKIKVNFKNTSNNANPEFGSEGASGFDIRAFVDEPLTLQPGEFIGVPTGLFFELPEGFELQVRPRSGLAIKNGITVLNTPGTVDNDYTGEIKVIMINHGKIPFTIYNGDRIAQGVLANCYTKKIIELTQVKELTKNTERGSNGFGSTGTK